MDSYFARATFEQQKKIGIVKACQVLLWSLIWRKDEPTKKVCLKQHVFTIYTQLCLVLRDTVQEDDRCWARVLYVYVTPPCSSAVLLHEKPFTIKIASPVCVFLDWAVWSWEDRPFGTDNLRPTCKCHLLTPRLFSNPPDLLCHPPYPSLCLCLCMLTCCPRWIPVCHSAVTRHLGYHGY